MLILAGVCLVGLVTGPSITTLYAGCALLMAALMWVTVRRDPPGQGSLSRLRHER